MAPNRAYSLTGSAEQRAGRADFFSTIGDIELLGGAERGWFFSEGVRAAMTGQEALFIPTFSWPHLEAVAGYFGLPVFDLGLIRSWSAEEIEFRTEAYARLATMRTYLADLRMDDIDISTSVALTLLPGIERALAYRCCMDMLAAAGHRRICILADPLASNGGLIHAVLNHAAPFRRGRWLRVDAAGLHPTPFPVPFALTPHVPLPLTPGPQGILPGPANPPRVFPVPRPAVKGDEAVVSSNARFDRAASLVRAGLGGRRAAGVGRLHRDAILVSTASAYPLYSRHTAAILAELEARQEPYQILLIPPAHKALFPDVPHDALFVQPNMDRRVWSDAEFRPVWSFIRNRVRAMAQGMPSIGALGAAYAAESHYYASSIHELLDAGARLLDIVREIQPRAIWLANARDPGDDLLMSIAEVAGIPVLTGLPALVVDNVISAPFFSGKAIWAVEGEMLRDLYLSRGHAPDRMILTGAPHLDRYYRLDRAAIARDFRSRHGIPDGCTVFLVITSRIDPEAENAWLRELMIWARGGNRRLLYKKHPDHAWRDYPGLERMVAEMDAAHFIWSDLGPGESICAADVCITDQSTSGIEVALLRRPMIQVRLGRADRMIIDFAAEGVALAAETPADLLRHAAQLEGRSEMPPDGRAQFLRRYNWGDDGAAAARICDFLSRPPVVARAKSPPLLECVF